MTRARHRIVPLALLLAAAPLAGCHHDAPDRAQRTADLMISLSRIQLTIIEGMQTRLAPKPPCADAKRTVVAFVRAQGKQLRPQAAELKQLLAHISPDEIRRAVGLARPEMGVIMRKSQTTVGTESKIARAFANRCPDAAKAILAENRKLLAVMHEVEQVARQ